MAWVWVAAVRLRRPRPRPRRAAGVAVGTGSSASAPASAWTTPTAAPPTAPSCRFRPATAARASIDAPGGATANGTIVEVWSCNGGANQQFSFQSDGTIRGSQSGKCVTVLNAATASGSKLILWTCNSGGNEHWSRG
ncbi:MAG: hypothetical protein E6G35_12615 [Actinobacteria bacterium]|nr:MAG: hypothetical protein E6G35_12615 [Actinomycetota bacterium]